MTPGTLALDFDGVVCDGLAEYFQTAWQAYCRLFQPKQTAPPAGLAERFYPLRPVVESGWEMPLLLHALQSDYGDGDILRDWSAIAPQLAQATHLKPSQLAAAVDGVRDHWIQTDLDNWLAQHRFYPGVIERIQQAQSSGIEIVIISTKEGRFINQLLQQAGILLSEQKILGKEVKRPKYQSLHQLQPYLPKPIWFVEDRIQALLAVKEQKELADIGLFLAQWGYNTSTDRQRAEQDERIYGLDLDTLVNEFAAWVS